VGKIQKFTFRYGIAPKLSQGSQKPRIEVFNPVEENDDQKTTTTILFDNNFQFLAFGTKALQRYAEIIDDGETALLFQTVSYFLI
jgi:hypothetical protein